MIRLRLNALLLERNMTAYQLWKASGLAKNTAYAMARSAPRNQLDLPTLERAMQAIAAQSGCPVQLEDVLEFQTDETP